MATLSDLDEDIYGDEVDDAISPRFEGDRKEVDRRQSELISRLESETLGLESDQEQEDFKKNYGSCLRGGEFGTIVHAIVAKCNNADFAIFKPILLFLVRRFPSLLEERNQHGDTALHLALQSRLSHVAVYLCECAEVPALAISSQGHHMGNCVHSSIRWRLDSTYYLISACDESTLVAQDDEGNTPLHLAVRFEMRHRPADLNIVRQLLNKCPRAADILNKDKLSPYREHLESYKYYVKLLPTLPRLVQRVEESSKERTPVSRDLRLKGLNRLPRRKDSQVARDKDEKKEPTDPEAISKVIRDLLKEHYLGSNCTREECMTYLYGESQTDALEIDFDLQGITAVTDAFLSDISQFLRFESILRYVFLPEGWVKPSSNQGLNEPRSNLKDKGSSLFKWLYASMKVEKIIRVIVQDSRENPHSDEAIEDAIKAFGVQELDWMRHDICSDTILRGAPDVRKLHLYWSGSNPVLKAWSASDGLAQLGKLERVYLTISPGLETRSRTMSNVEEFLRRLHLLRGDVEVDFRFEETDGTFGPSSVLKSLDRRRPGLWQMDSLADLIMDFLNGRQFMEMERDNVEMDRESEIVPVRICLIDDGVDASTGNVRSVLFAGRSFGGQHAYGDLTPSWYTSSRGHGTKMARIICENLRFVHLYVARVDEVNGNLLKDQVSKATLWAVESGVDIICLGQQLKPAATFEQDFRELQASFERARNKGIAVLSVWSNQPQRASDTPTSSTIGIRAWTDTGLDFPVNKGPYSARYALPITGLQDGRSQDGETQVDDNSAAAALGCRLAILTLLIARRTQRQMEKSSELVEGVFRRLNLGRPYEDLVDFTELTDLLESDREGIAMDVIIAKIASRLLGI